MGFVEGLRSRVWVQSRCRETKEATVSMGDLSSGFRLEVRGNLHWLWGQHKRVFLGSHVAYIKWRDLSWPGRLTRTGGTLEFLLAQIPCDSQFLEVKWTGFLKCFPHILHLGPFSLWRL